jgi:3-phenylpropionate/trans-cinnamate dioxygenase ferredoxin reductase component
VRTERPSVVIVGAGLAGFTLASALTQQGYAGAVTLVGEEPWQPYDRPPLSKHFQLGGDESQIWLKPELPSPVKLLTPSRVVSIDAQGQTLMLDDGHCLPWDRLVLATGTRPRRLEQLASFANVLTLRTLDDARAIRAALTSVTSLLVIGGGPIGLELASSARALGLQSSVVEMGPRLMARSAPAAIAEILCEHHRSQGTQIHLGRTVAALDQAAQEAVLDNGHRVPAGLVVVGIGVLANDDLAAQAGIACDDGIFVDGWCRTSAPDVFAIGDVTRQGHGVTGRFQRIETWANAQGQAQALAGILCRPDEARAYDAVPWFWSDQGSARLQCAGAITGEQQAWRAGDAGGRVLVQWHGGCITGVAALNAARDFVQLKKLILPRTTLTPEQLSAPVANIRTLVQQALIL